MPETAFKSSAAIHGGRVIVLFLLFLLAVYQFYAAGFGAFAIVCSVPALMAVLLFSLRYEMFLFWTLFCVNYVLQWHNLSLPSGIPMSLYNELFEILLIILAILKVKYSEFGRMGNLMLYTLLVWCGFCTLEVLNDTCGIGLDVGRWYTAARLMAFQLMYAFVVYTLYISTPNRLASYLFLWGGFALFAVFWVWKQRTFGFTDAENAWLQTRGRTTHILQAGTLIRYFSVFSDAANFGIGIASTAVAFIIFGITSKIKKHKYFFLITGFACLWGMFLSGTRTAIACVGAGFIFYIFLSKSFKIAIPFTAIFLSAFFILAFTNIGNGNQQIRRMRSAFDSNDASRGTRAVNQESMKKYLNEAPWGIGMSVGYNNVPANNKYTFMATVPPDSEYVFIWIHTGIIGITLFLICTAAMLFGASWIVFFTLKSPSLRGIGAGFCCAFVSQQLGGYGNQVLMQFPNCLIFYGGLTIVYILPFIQDEWNEYEKLQLEREEEHRRIKLERKRALQV